MDRRQTTQYLHRLFGAEDRIEVAYIKDGSARRVERDMSHLDNLLEEFERAEESGWNVFVGALPLDLQEAGRYDRVWVDQDDVDAPYPFGADPGWEYPAFPDPSTLVRTSEEPTGFRYQAIWKLDRALPEAEGRALIRALAARLGSDRSVVDRRRVLRVPGLLNAKRGQATHLISSSTRETRPAEFSLPDEETIQDLLQVQVQNPNHILGEWLDGTAEGDRSRKAYVAARFLKGCGVSFDDAGAVLLLGASRCEPPFSEDEVLHVLRSAYHREEGR